MLVLFVISVSWLGQIRAEDKRRNRSRARTSTFMLYTWLHLLFFKSHYVSPLKFREAKRRPAYCQNLAVGSQTIERQSSISSMKQESTPWTSLLTYQVKCFQGSYVHVWFYVRLPDCIIWSRLERRSWRLQSFQILGCFFFFFCKIMTSHIALWPSSSFANYILPEYVPLTLHLDKVLFSFSLFPPETVWWS